MEKVNAISFGNRTGCPSKFYLEVYSLQNFFIVVSLPYTSEVRQVSP